MRAQRKILNPAILAFLIGFQTACIPMSADDCKGATAPNCEIRGATVMKGKVELGDGSGTAMAGVKVIFRAYKYDGQCGTGECEKFDSTYTDSVGMFQAENRAVEYADYQITLEKEGYKAASVYEGREDEIFNDLKCQMLEE